VSRNDDEHLFSSPANAARLMRAFEDSRAGRNMVRMTLEELDAWVEERLAAAGHRRI
jgi:hypothetical protein